MISGLNSSGITKAIRTAGQARATMDIMARQIATGQRVASVRDDSAAWTRAAALQSQIAQVDGRDFIVAALKTASAIQGAQTELAREAFAELRNIFVSAAQYQPGSSPRMALQAEFVRAIESLTQVSAPTGVISSGAASWPEGWGVQASTSDPLLAGEVVFTTNGLGFGTGGTNWTLFTPPTFAQNIAATDVLNGTTAAMNEAVRLADYWLNQHLPFHERESADDQNWFDRIERTSSRERDRIGTAIGSLTDADLGKASAARATAETRQQLALTTVRQAISTYGAYAGGLLGNAQRTQRGVIA